MTNAENKEKQPTPVVELEEIAPGVRGRTVSAEELEVTEDQVKKLAEKANSEVFADFIYRLYKIKRPQK